MTVCGFLPQSQTNKYREAVASSFTSPCCPVWQTADCSIEGRRQRRVEKSKARTITFDCDRPSMRGPIKHFLSCRYLPVATDGTRRIWIDDVLMLLKVPLDWPEKKNKDRRKNKAEEGPLSNHFAQKQYCPNSIATRARQLIHNRLQPICFPLKSGAGVMRVTDTMDTQN